MSDIVSYSMSGDVAVVNINSPPVNAVAPSVRAGLKQVFIVLRGKREVKAIVLACAGRTFVAGEDITSPSTRDCRSKAHCRPSLNRRPNRARCVTCSMPSAKSARSPAWRGTSSRGG